MFSGMIKTTTRLRGRQTSSPLPFRVLYDGRLTATDIESDDFERKLKIYQMAFLELCRCSQCLVPVPVGEVPVATHSPLSQEKGEKKDTIIIEVNEPINQSNQAN